jgi:hypothetical protein
MLRRSTRPFLSANRRALWTNRCVVRCAEKPEFVWWLLPIPPAFYTWSVPGQCHTIPHERSPGTPSTAVDSCAPAKSFLDALDYVAVSVSSAMLAWAIWVVPVVAGGQSTSENLALACVSCSLRKGARLVMVDPHTGEEVVLFDPRRDAWRLHFRWDGVRVVGITPTGRATVMALHMNRPVVS